MLRVYKSTTPSINSLPVPGRDAKDAYVCRAVTYLFTVSSSRSAFAALSLLFFPVLFQSTTVQSTAVQSTCIVVIH